MKTTVRKLKLTHYELRVLIEALNATLTVYIKRLREKIEEDPQNPEIIKTIRGLGYRIDA